jgi:hypothetical protein
MRERKRDRDHRESFRCPVTDARRHGELTVGSEVLAARLLDESAGGFAVLIDRLAGLEVGKTAELSTDAGRFAVRVMHVTQVDSTEADGEPADQQPPFFRLGLLRAGEAALPRPPTVSLLAENLRFRIGQWQSPGTLMIALVLFAATAAAVPLGLIGARWELTPPSARQPSRSDEWLASGSPPRKAPLLNPAEPTADAFPRSRETAKPRPAGSVSRPARGQAQESAHSTSLSWRELQKTIPRLPGATAFTLPEVIERLRLTDDQQRQIRRLIETTAQTARDLDRQLSGQQRHEVSELRERLLDETRREALKLLTDPQHAEWEKLTGLQAAPAPPQGK